MLFKEIKPLNTLKTESTDYLETTNINYLESVLQESINVNNNITHILIENMENLNNFIISEDSNTSFFSDMFIKLRDIFKALWDYILKLWDKFLKSNKKISKKLENFVADCVRDITDVNGKTYRGYIYTIENKNINFNFNIFSDNLTQNLDLIKLKEYENKVKSEEYYDEIRGAILGKSYSFKENYTKELYMYFRNGTNKQRDINITTSLKDEMINSICNYRETFNSCQSLKMQMDTFYKDIINYFNHMISITKDGNIAIFDYEEKNNRLYKSNNYNIKDDSKNTYLNYQKLAKLKAEEARKVANILNVTFAAKLDAINERYIVYLDVLKKLMKERTVERFEF